MREPQKFSFISSGLLLRVVKPRLDHQVARDIRTAGHLGDDLVLLGGGLSWAAAERVRAANRMNRSACRMGTGYLGYKGQKRGKDRAF
jgi:hypothetical protein